MGRGIQSYPNWKAEGNDRILIFEDTDGDGHFDKVKVFWDKGNYLSGLTLGFGGVWVCCAPNLYFIPLKDDDTAGEPVAVLDGFGTTGKHNVINSLTWGPDGWLYGCSGITGPGRVGKPGTLDSERIAINAGCLALSSDEKSLRSRAARHDQSVGHRLR